MEDESGGVQTQNKRYLFRIRKDRCVASPFSHPIMSHTLDDVYMMEKMKLNQNKENPWEEVGLPVYDSLSQFPR